MRIFRRINYLVSNQQISAVELIKHEDQFVWMRHVKPVDFITSLEEIKSREPIGALINKEERSQRYIFPFYEDDL